jgi:HSP20 family protein
MSYLVRWQRPQFPSWSPLNRLTSLRSEIDRLFESPLADLTQASRLLSGWSPALDVHEDKDNFVVRAELPGMKKEDIELSLHGGGLSISGERKSDQKYEDAEVYRSERFVGRFQRTVTLPTPVAAAGVKAQYRDGILTVTLPKSEESKPKQIEVKVG